MSMYYKCRNIFIFILTCLMIICLFPQTGRCEPIIDKVIYPLYHEVFDELNKEKYGQKYEIGPLIESGKDDSDFAFSLKINNYESIIGIKTDNFHKPSTVYIIGRINNDNEAENLLEACYIFALLCDISTEELKKGLSSEDFRSGNVKIWSQNKQKYFKISVNKSENQQNTYIKFVLTVDK